MGCSKSVSDFEDEGFLAQSFRVQALLVLALTRELNHG